MADDHFEQTRAEDIWRHQALLARNELRQLIVGSREAIVTSREAIARADERLRGALIGPRH